MEQSVTRAVHQHLATMAWIYGRADYVGMVDVAVAVLGIAQARAASLVHSFHPGPAYGASDYRRHARSRPRLRVKLRRRSSAGW